MWSVRDAVVVVLGAVALLGAASARIEELTVDHDSRPVVLMEVFGFDVHGRFELRLDNVVMHFQKATDVTLTPNAKFVLKRSLEPATYPVPGATAPFCFHEYVFDSQMHVFDTKYDLAHAEKTSDTSVSFPTQTFALDVINPGLYHLFWSNCAPGSSISFTATLTEYNAPFKGSDQRDYLSIGESPLPTVFALSALLLVVEAAVWIRLLRRSEAHQVKKIHHLMTFVVAVKAIASGLDAIKLATLKATGVFDEWAYLFYIAHSIRTLAFFAGIVLIGNGWSYMTPFITARDKRIITAVLSLQVVVNIALVVEETTMPGFVFWLRTRDILLMLDIICCCAILFPLMWSIQHLKQTISSRNDEKAAQNLGRLKRFRKFYGLVVVYIYTTRIIVLLMASLLPYRMTWLSTLTYETATIVFYALTGWWFRPATQTPYIPIDQDNVELISLDEHGLTGDDLDKLIEESSTI
ncbi:unnamed protein product (mitochondrion) [Plasmodiophora brassicae]|uniref:Intimal thickness related receptor IRP domain-containing protein n=1 Tax=Plasmodiophora brassicae TaxID=37360 RepID=A0A0G4INU5_PLABS|nr:hypothetical protein PBRA_005436 [Plasmodiophora brassicae]SPR01789.1 unnamed protein product [Plasmodiophora brassicae]